MLYFETLPWCHCKFRCFTKEVVTLIYNVQSTVNFTCLGSFIVKTSKWPLTQRHLLVTGNKVCVTINLAWNIQHYNAGFMVVLQQHMVETGSDTKCALNHVHCHNILAWRCHTHNSSQNMSLILLHWAVIMGRVSTEPGKKMPLRSIG